MLPSVQQDINMDFLSSSRLKMLKPLVSLPVLFSKASHTVDKSSNKMEEMAKTIKRVNSLHKEMLDGWASREEEVDSLFDQIRKGVFRTYSHLGPRP